MFVKAQLLRTNKEFSRSSNSVGCHRTITSRMLGVHNSGGLSTSHVKASCVYSYGCLHPSKSCLCYAHFLIDPRVLYCCDRAITSRMLGVHNFGGFSTSHVKASCVYSYGCLACATHRRTSTFRHLVQRKLGRPPSPRALCRTFRLPSLHLGVSGGARFSGEYESF